MINNHYDNALEQLHFIEDYISSNDTLINSLDLVRVFNDSKGRFLLLFDDNLEIPDNDCIRELYLKEVELDRNDASSPELIGPGRTVIDCTENPFQNPSKRVCKDFKCVLDSYHKEKFSNDLTIINLAIQDESTIHPLETTICPITQNHLSVGRKSTTDVMVSYHPAPNNRPLPALTSLPKPNLAPATSHSIHSHRSVYVDNNDETQLYSVDEQDSYQLNTDEYANESHPSDILLRDMTACIDEARSVSNALRAGGSQVISKSGEYLDRHRIPSPTGGRGERGEEDETCLEPDLLMTVTEVEDEVSHSSDGCQRTRTIGFEDLAADSIETPHLAKRARSDALISVPDRGQVSEHTGDVDVESFDNVSAGEEGGGARCLMSEDDEKSHLTLYNDACRQTSAIDWLTINCPQKILSMLHRYSSTRSEALADTISHGASCGSRVARGLQAGRGAIVYVVDRVRRVRDNSGLMFSRWMACRLQIPLIAVVYIAQAMYEGLDDLFPTYSIGADRSRRGRADLNPKGPPILKTVQRRRNAFRWSALFSLHEQLLALNIPLLPLLDTSSRSEISPDDLPTRHMEKEFLDAPVETVNSIFDSCGGHRDSVALVISRAVSLLSTLLGYTESEEDAQLDNNGQDPESGLTIVCSHQSSPSHDKRFQALAKALPSHLFLGIGCDGDWKTASGYTKDCTPEGTTYLNIDRSRGTNSKFHSRFLASKGYEEFLEEVWSQSQEEYSALVDTETSLDDSAYLKGEIHSRESDPTIVQSEIIVKKFQEKVKSENHLISLLDWKDVKLSLEGYYEESIPGFPMMHDDSQKLALGSRSYQSWLSTENSLFQITRFRWNEFQAESLWDAIVDDYFQSFNHSNTGSLFEPSQSSPSNLHTPAANGALPSAGDMTVKNKFIKPPAFTYESPIPANPSRHSHPAPRPSTCSEAMEDPAGSGKAVGRMCRLTWLEEAIGGGVQCIFDLIQEGLLSPGYCFRQFALASKNKQGITQNEGRNSDRSLWQSMVLGPSPAHRLWLRLLESRSKDWYVGMTSSCPSVRDDDMNVLIVGNESRSKANNPMSWLDRLPAVDRENCQWLMKNRDVFLTYIIAEESSDEAAQPMRSLEETPSKPFLSPHWVISGNTPDGVFNALQKILLGGGIEQGGVLGLYWLSKFIGYLLMSGLDLLSSVKILVRFVTEYSIQVDGHDNNDDGTLSESEAIGISILLKLSIIGSQLRRQETSTAVDCRNMKNKMCVVFGERKLREMAAYFN